jgi:biopolymer transport protein ExbB/TolQ
MAQILLVPVMCLLVLLIAFAVYSIGSIIVEAAFERRHYRLNSEATINAMHDSPSAELEAIIEGAAILRPQRNALLTVARNRHLSEDDLYALARTQLAKVDDRHRRTLNLTEQVTKIAPMLGLMCTLIPLGPGIVAMGRGDVAQLSLSLGIAFDGTVAGLLAAVVALVVTGLRKRWYAQYILELESLISCVLDKASQDRDRRREA